MPRNGLQTSHAATIEITDFQSTYVPGDTILGHVVTQQAFAQGPNADQALVRLKLFGRAKTKITDKSGKFTVTYRGRAVLFEEQQCIFRGAVIAGARIPFAITIPDTPQPGFETRGDSWDKDKSDNQEHIPHSNVYLPAQKYLSTTQEDVTKHKLPSVFYFKNKSSWTGSVFEGFVEYALEATLICPKADNVVTVFPLLVRAQSTEKHIQAEDYKFYVKDSLNMIRSDRLLPENAERKMSLLEKSRKIFAPSKTPKYSYTAKLVYPQVIQLEHPDPIPFKIYIVPIFNEAQTTICTDGDIRSLPPVEFISMKLELIACTRLRCEGSFPGTYHGEDRNVTHEIPFRGSFQPFTFKVPTVVRGNLGPVDQTFLELGKAPHHQNVPITSKVSPYIEPGALNPIDDDSVVPDGPIEYTRFQVHNEGKYFLGTPFDLGSHLDLRLSRKGSSTLGTDEVPFEEPIWPSFATYNIVHAYKLAWSINLSCVGEEKTVTDRADITILPPSEQQEAKKKEALGQEGMQKTYDDIMIALDNVSTGLEMGLELLQAIIGA